MKSNVYIHLPYKTNIINLSIEEGYFPDKRKLAEVSLIFNKKDDLGKENCGPTSVSPHVSKAVERIMYHQINDSMTNDHQNNYQDLEQIIVHNTI